MFSDEGDRGAGPQLHLVARSTDARLGAPRPRRARKDRRRTAADLRAALEGSSLLVSDPPRPPNEIDLALVRTAIRTEHKLGLGCADASGRHLDRVVWPALSASSGGRG